MTFTLPRVPDASLSSTAVARIAVALCVWVVATGNSPLSSEALPLFTSFKTLCIDTDAKPDAVEAAVVAKGGRPSPAELTIMMPGGYAQKFRSWTLVVNRRELKVFSHGDYVPEHRGRPAYETDDCSVQASHNDGPSVAATRAWVGVPPFHETDSVTAYFYDQFGSRRVPARHPDLATYMKAITAGNTYMLNITQHDGLTTLSISRFHLSTR
jgi:hypothetical protein